MSIFSNLYYNYFKYSPYVVALALTVLGMHFFSDIHTAGAAVEEYSIAGYALFSLMLFMVIVFTMTTTSDRRVDSYQEGYAAAWQQVVPRGNFFNWQRFLDDAMFAQLSLLKISLTFTIGCAVIKLAEYPILNDNNLFNLFILLEAYFMILAFYFFGCTELIAARVKKQRTPGATPGDNLPR